MWTPTVCCFKAAMSGPWRALWAATKDESERRDRHDRQTVRRRQSGFAGTPRRIS
jgi:hypothetical protein